MSETWKIDPKTGDYVMQGGAPVIETSLLTPAYIRLKTPRTKWMYAPDNQYGSDFYKQRLKRSMENVNQLRLIALNALRSFIVDQRADKVDVTFAEQSRYGVGYKIDITDSQGEIESLNLPPIGNGE